MKTHAVPLLTILTFCLFFTDTALARQPIVPNAATMDKVHLEISKIIQTKEYDSTETLSLYRCYGKVYLEANKKPYAKQIKTELEKLGITTERLKVSQKNHRSYLIISLLGHDKLELKNLITEMTSKTNKHIITKNWSETREVLFTNLGCTELPLQE